MASFEEKKDESGTRIELFIECVDLPKPNLMGKRDTFAVVHAKSGIAEYHEIARTEVVSNNTNPRYTSQVFVDYHFSQSQYVKITIYDDDSKSENNDLSNNRFIGEATFTLGALVTSRSNTLTIPLVGKNNEAKGQVIIRGEELAATHDYITFQFSASNLSNKEAIGKSSPFYCISRLREDRSIIPVFRSEVIANNLSPTWKVQELSSQKLSNSDNYRPLIVEIFASKQNGRHESMGKVELNVQDMLDGKAGCTFDIMEENKTTEKNYTNSGTLTIVQVDCVQRHSFIDYIKGGCEVSLIVAIDFTASNGIYTEIDSLHYLDPSNQRMNDYQRAISSIGSILAPYDSDNKYPVYGFGARFGNNRVVSHCFPLTTSVSVTGVEGIQQAYKDVLPQIALSGPTLFQPLLQEVKRIANQTVTQTSQKYFVLLIIADGVIDDMKKTIDELVALSNLPISIIVVGVGNGDFSGMQALDSDDALLFDSRGLRATRDIVQFVPFRKFDNDNITALSNETLAEVPTQFLSYMQARHILPNLAETIPDIAPTSS